MTNHTAGKRRRLLSHLRSLDRRRWLAWLAANTLGWAASLFGYRVLADVFHLNVEVDQNAFVIATGIVSAAIYGAITGYAPVRLLRHRPVPTATPPPPASVPPRA